VKHEEHSLEQDFPSSFQKISEFSAQNSLQKLQFLPEQDLPSSFQKKIKFPEQFPEKIQVYSFELGSKIAHKNFSEHEFAKQHKHTVETNE
jgi:hypothetical protein